MKTACVLGGHGMIGVQLVNRLKQEGFGFARWILNIQNIQYLKQIVY